jgi:hypothetical protein
MANPVLQKLMAATAYLADVAYEIARSPRFRFPLHVRTEVYYSDVGEPGRAIDASDILSAYVEAHGRYGQFDVSVKDRGAGTEVGKICSSRADAVEWAVDELLYRGALASYGSAPTSDQRQTREIPAVSMSELMGVSS